MAVVRNSPAPPVGAIELAVTAHLDKSRCPHHRLGPVSGNGFARPAARNSEQCGEAVGDENLAAHPEQGWIRSPRRQQRQGLMPAPNL